MKNFKTLSPFIALALMSGFAVHEKQYEKTPMTEEEKLKNAAEKQRKIELAEEKRMCKRKKRLSEQLERGV